MAKGWVQHDRNGVALRITTSRCYVTDALSGMKAHHRGW